MSETETTRLLKIARELREFALGEPSEMTRLQLLNSAWAIEHRAQKLMPSPPTDDLGGSPAAAPIPERKAA